MWEFNQPLLDLTDFSPEARVVWAELLRCFRVRALTSSGSRQRGSNGNLRTATAGPSPAWSTNSTSNRATTSTPRPLVSTPQSSFAFASTPTSENLEFLYQQLPDQDASFAPLFDHEVDCLGFLPEAFASVPTSSSSGPPNVEFIESQRQNMTGSGSVTVEEDRSRNRIAVDCVISSSCWNQDAASSGSIERNLNENPATLNTESNESGFHHVESRFPVEPNPIVSRLHSWSKPIIPQKSQRVTSSASLHNDLAFGLMPDATFDAGVLNNSSISLATKEKTGGPDRQFMNTSNLQTLKRSCAVNSNQLTQRLMQVPNLSYFSTEDSSSAAVTSTSKKQSSVKISHDEEQREIIGSQPKKGKFSIPLKNKSERSVLKQKSAEQLSSCAEAPKAAAEKKSRLCSVLKMSDAQRHQLLLRLAECSEAALTLKFADNSSQLRRTPQKKGYKDDPEPSVAALVVVMVVPSQQQQQQINILESQSNDGSLIFVKFPLVNERHLLYSYVRDFISRLMAAKDARLMCIDAQELIRTLIAHFKYDMQQVACSWMLYDVLIGAWLLDPDNPPASMDNVLKRFPHLPQMSDSSSISSSGDAQLCSDLTLLGALLVELHARLSACSLWRLYTHLELPLCATLAVLELRGIAVDLGVMQRSCALLTTRLERLESAVYKAAGLTFSINSHPQLRQILFDKLQLDKKFPDMKIARTSVGRLKSTSEGVLRRMKGAHPLPGLVLDYRHAQKLKATYVDGLLGCVEGGELRTHWDHTASATGRLTSVNPNLQAVPKISLVVGKQESTEAEAADDGPPLEVFAREPFVSRTGWTFLAADFQQIELRILAHLSNDPILLELFTEPDSGDVFTGLASQWFNKSVGDVISSEREQTKRVVYSVMYGAGKDRLADYLGVTVEEAKNIMQSFLISFPGINAFRRKTIEETKRQGYNCTLFKRRRLFPNINHSDFHLRSYAERQAVNFRVQGSAADLCKAAMLQVEQAFASVPHLQARLLIQIHDELIFEVLSEHLHPVATLLKRTMESPDTLCRGFAAERLRVPLRVSLSAGANWGHVKEYTG